MFIGPHPVTIDAKGRIAIPASYRQSLLDDCGGRLVVTRHWDGCLLVYPFFEFEQFKDKLLARGGLNRQVRDIQRFFIGNARPVDMDRQGRLLLPGNLRAYASLDGKAVLSGMGKMFELWDEALFDERNADTGADLAERADNDELPEMLMDIGL